MELMETTVEVGTPVGMSLDVQTRGEIDMQIATAKRYPRSIKKFLDDVMTLATLTDETAAACFYNKPQAGEMISGPSARLAEMVASCWGNLMVDGRPVADDGRFVTSRGTAWDLQNNVRFSFEAKRRVTNRHGVRYSDDMVMTTTNAATSIAMRNAIFKAVPRAFWGQVEERCREVARGKADTLVSIRSRMLKHFATLGVTADRVFTRLDVRGLEDVTLEHVELLRGLATGIKEGDTTIDEAFPLAPRFGPLADPATQKSTLDKLADAMGNGPTAVSELVNATTAALAGSAAEQTRAAARKQQAVAHERPRAHREPGDEDQLA